MRIVANGQSIVITNGRVYVNGIEEGSLQKDDLTVELHGEVRALTIEGQNMNVTIKGDVHGPVQSKGSVTCGNVGASVDASGSVTCGTVNGNVDAGGSVTAGQVAGNIDAGGSVMCSR